MINKMAKDNYGLLLAALVAIVAVVGLVILFSGANSGASYACPNGQMVLVVSPTGGQGATICVPGQEVGALMSPSTRYEQAQRELMIAQEHRYY